MTPSDILPAIKDLAGQLQQALGEEFAVERELGSTRLARVFIARERLVNRAVQIAVLSPSAIGDLQFERFVETVEQTAALDHPGIIPPIAIGAAAGLPYVVTPYVPGVTLRERLAEKPALSLEEIVTVLRDLAGALEYAHARGALHLAIAPEQILLSQKMARLSDFGIERALASSQRAPRVDGGQGAVTSTYRAPEQRQSSTAGDHRSDLFAWGCAAYEMLTDVAPFDDDPAPITLTRRDVPASLVRLIMRCLSRDPADRPANAANLVQVLQTVDVSERAQAERMPTPAYVPAITRQVTAQQEVVLEPRGRFAGWTARRAAPFAGALLAAIAVAGWMLSRGEKKPEEAPAMPPPPRPAVVAQSVVVLPLVPAGPSIDSAFGAGLSAAIAGAVAKSGLPVFGRITAQQLRARGLDPRAIARELGAVSALTGTIAATGDSLQLSLSLIAAKDGNVQWTANYTRSAADALGIEVEIARIVAAALRDVPLPAPGLAGVPETRDPLARAAVFRGTAQLQRMTPRGLVEASAAFASAAARDPLYARAHASLALAHALSPTLAFAASAAAYDKATASAKRALALDSTSAAAYHALALVHLGRGENRAAEAQFRRALAHDSTTALAWSGYAQLANHIGDYAMARRRLGRVRMLESQLALSRIWEAQIARGEGNRGQAESLTRSKIAPGAETPVTLATRAEALIDVDRAPEAMQLLDQASAAAEPASELAALLAYASARADNVDRARELMLAMRDASGGQLPPLATLAATLAALGDVDSAIGVLERAAARGDPSLVLFNHSGRFEVLRKDPRGAAVFAKIERW